jgi:hypothetical protein
MERSITIFGRTAQGLRAQNWRAVLLEFGVIVIGVMIGLQASNWNEDRATEAEVDALIQNLQIEFQSSRSTLATTRTQLDLIMESSRELLSLFGQQEIGMSDTELDGLIEMTFFWPTWSPSNSVSRELISSGYLSVLDEDGIKPLLFEWERSLAQVEEWNRRMERSSQDLIDFVKDHGSLRNANHNRISIDRSVLDVGNRRLLSEPGFENYVDEKLMMSQFLAAQYQAASDLIDEIIDASESYLRGGA